MLCNHCGQQIPDDAKFCDKCGKTVEKISGVEQIKKYGAKKYFKDFFLRKFHEMKNPRKWIPTLALTIVWAGLTAVTPIVGNMPVVSQLVAFLNFITFSNIGLFQGFFSTVGGIIGKIIVAAFLNEIIMPLFDHKNPFADVKQGLLQVKKETLNKSIKSLSPVFFGSGLGTLVYAFVSVSQCQKNSMVGIASAVLLASTIAKKGDKLFEALFALLNDLSPKFTPSYSSVKKTISGSVVGTTLGTALSLIRQPVCLWLGGAFLLISLVLFIINKTKKEAK